MGRGQLPKKTHAAITRLCKEGDALVDAGDDEAAYEKYKAAWDLVPEDKGNWEASTWILAAAGDIHFHRKNYEEALNRFLRAVQCPNGLGNPYIHLRIGEIQFELGNLEGPGGAGDNLARAYMGADEEIFKDEDPKYLTYLRSILVPPAVKNDKKKKRNQ